MSDQKQTTQTQHTESGGHRSPNRGPREDPTLVSVHKDYVGAVIGKEGKTIKKIKDDTKTRISYMDEDFARGHQSPVFLITGPAQGRRKAAKWIRKILQSTWEAEQEETPQGDSTGGQESQDPVE